MIHRAIVATLLVGLGLPAFAASQFTGPAYDQAQGLASGRTQSNAVFDNNTAAGATQTQVAGAMATGGLTVPDPAAAPAAIRPDLTASTLPEVPAPATAPAHAKLFSTHSVLFGAGGAVIGATAGWLCGGPLGAVIGLLAGFLIGFVVSKFMH